MCCGAIVAGRVVSVLSCDVHGTLGPGCWSFGSCSKFLF